MTDYREITTRLTARSTQALGELTARTGLNETDIVNRALQMYASIAAKQASGAQILEVKGGAAHALTWE
ncbi:hypothetical protein [Nonomuraea sp. NPDC023979]|uniref:hypothetical protein n=1 Tax=Nonomuraea sp. NPDC023979 TaxID=3154796 RepID=UPI0033F57F1E